MSGDIVLSAALRNNLLSLQSTQRNIDTAQLRLATGLKVNSALDNPQNFFTAKALNNRASDLTRLLDGISQSIRTIEQANTGVETLGQLLDQAESIALEAQAEIRSSEGYTRGRGNVDLSTISNLDDLPSIVDGVSDEFRITLTQLDGTVSSLDINIPATNYTVDSIVAAINSDTGVGGLGLVAKARVTDAGYLEIQSLVENAAVRVSGLGIATDLTASGYADLGLSTFVGAEDSNAAPGALRQGGTTIAGNTLFSGASAAPVAANGEYEASADLVTAGYLAAAGDDIEIELTVDGVTTVLPTSVTGTDTIQDVVDRINNEGPTGVAASFNVDTGRIELEFAETIGQVELQFNDNAASTTSFGFGTGAGDAALGGNSSSEFFTFDGVNPDVDQFQEDYNNVRTQIDQLVEDANYRGVNLLKDDDLTTFFNEDRDHTLETQGVDFTSAGLGIEEGDFTNAANVQQSIDSIRGAVDDVRNFGQSIANDLSIVQVRRDFTSQTINTLKSGADDLVVADQNEEGANLLALQTRQALGTTSLSLAAQSQQAVLRLF